MGIMNKMKTVDLGTLTWSLHSSVRGLFTSDDLKPTIMKPLNDYTKINLFNDRYNYYSWNTFIAAQPSISIESSGRIGVCDTSFTDAASFKQSMQGVILTYETIDSVEEEIAGLKDYAVILLDGSKPWERYAEISHSWCIRASTFIPSVKGGRLQNESTRLYRTPWVKMTSASEIDIVDNGAYVNNSLYIIITILSCNTVDEAKEYLNAYPIVIGYPTENGTHNSTLITQTEEIM